MFLAFGIMWEVFLFSVDVAFVVVVVAIFVSVYIPWPYGVVKVIFLAFPPSTCACVLIINKKRVHSYV